MNQALLELPPQTGAADRTGFAIGWDHARHALVPAPELLLDGSPVGQGWQAARAVFGRRTLTATRHVRQWLALRTAAWRDGIVFDETQVTAHHVGQIQATHCAVTRRPLGGAPGGEDAPVVVRLRADAGYGAGHLAVLSAHAAAARGESEAATLLRHAAQAEAGLADGPGGLSPAESWRLAVLASFVTPLPHAEAARVPLRALPPNRVRLLNAAQGLQALLTLQFAQPGWSERVRRVAALLPPSGGDGLRHDWLLLAGAIGARVVAAKPGSDPRAARWALEDVWADARVQRRWQTFALALGEAGCEALLERAAADGAAGVRAMLHGPAQAVEGWALATQGRVPATRSLRLLPPPRRGGPAAAARR